MKIFRIITVSVLAIGFLFHAPLQWGSVFVHAQDDMEMDMGMDHQAQQDCFEHCMSQAAQLADYPDVSIPMAVAVINVVADDGPTIQPSNFELPSDEAPPNDQVKIYTIQKRE